MSRKDYSDMHEEPSGETSFDVDFEKQKKDMLDSITQLMPNFKIPAKPISLGIKEIKGIKETISWLPDLVVKTDLICHLHTTPALKSVWFDRMQLAQKKKHKIYLAAPIDCLHEQTLLNQLVTLDAQIIALEKKKKGGWKAEHHSSVSSFISKKKIKLSKESLESIGRTIFDNALTSKNSNIKGKKFEEFLCLLFGQISPFEVYSTNYSTKTEEIDIVLRNGGGNIHVNSQIILLSAKNTKEPVGVPALTSIYSKMGNRKGTCRLGFLCSAGRIASTVYEHDLRYSQGDKAVVIMDKSALDSLLESDDKEKMIVDLITESVLR